MNCYSCASLVLALVILSLWPLGASVALLGMVQGLRSAEMSFVLDAVSNRISFISG